MLPDALQQCLKKGVVHMEPSQILTLLASTCLILPRLSILSSVGPRRLVDDSDNQSIHA